MNRSQAHSGELFGRRSAWTVWYLAAMLGAFAPRASAQSFADRVAELMAAPEFKQASWGILVAELDSGATLYELNAERLFVPASTTKLYSVAAALETLGADYRFHTPIHARGEIDAEGVLQGDLILVASGDLTLGGRTDVSGRIEFTDGDHTYAGFMNNAELTAADPLAGLKELARQVSQSGIKQVTGDVLIDDRLFDSTNSSGSGPEHCSPILVNDNVIDVIYEPTAIGQPATVRIRPECSAIVMDARVTTVAAGQETHLLIDYPDERTLVVRGRIAADAKKILHIVEVSNPANFARRLLIDALNGEGVGVDASVASENRVDSLPAQDAYDSLRKVAELESPPFAENARLILKVSHNLHASTLPLLMAVKNGKRNLADGLKCEAEALSRIGFDIQAISFGGGAGGTRADYITPRATVDLLRAATKRPFYAAYREAMPILGVDGTLHAAADENSPARGKFQAKTGTLLWQNGLTERMLLTSKALAGYGETASGKHVALALFVNNVHLNEQVTTTYVGRKLGRICELIYESF